MPTAIDIFASTNPAFCSLIIHAFVNGFFEEGHQGPHISLAFLPVPVVLSEEIADLFEGTNGTTGLLGWTSRHPEIQSLISTFVAPAAEISRSGLLFGLQQGVLQVVEDTKLMGVSDVLTRIPTDKNPASLPKGKRYFTNAICFGKWCGRVGDARLIYAVLGVQP